MIDQGKKLSCIMISDVTGVGSKGEVITVKERRLLLAKKKVATPPLPPSARSFDLNRSLATNPSRLKGHFRNFMYPQRLAERRRVRAG